MTPRPGGSYKCFAIRTRHPMKPFQHSTAAASPAALPRQRAFVLQLASDVDPATGLRGRVVHIASGGAARFEDVTDLLRFVEASVTAAENAEPTNDTPLATVEDRKPG